MDLQQSIARCYRIIARFREIVQSVDDHPEFIEELRNRGDALSIHYKPPYKALFVTLVSEPFEDGDYQSALAGLEEYCIEKNLSVLNPRSAILALEIRKTLNFIIITPDYLPPEFHQYL